MRGKAEFKTMDVSIGKGIGTDTQNDLMDINKNIAKGFSELDEDMVVEKGVRENLGKILDAGTRVSERAMQNRHIYPEKAEKYDRAAKKLFGKFDELKNPNLNKVKGYEDIEVKGCKKQYKELEDDIKVKGVFSSIKKLIRPVKEANVVPDDIKAGLDRVSKYNRVNTTLARNGSGPAQNTIMANKQEAGSHLTGLRPNVDAFRGAQRVQEGISIPVGGRRPNSYDKPLTKGVDSLIVED